MKYSRWLLLAHQLPAHPSNVRVRVWRKLQALGAVPIKNSIYVLPDGPAAREDFEWLKKEILQMKGEASIFIGDSISDMDNGEIVKVFQETRARDFDRIIADVETLCEKADGALKGGHLKDGAIERLGKEWGSLQEDLDRLRRIDFFKAPKGREAERAAHEAQRLFQRAKAMSLKKAPEPPPSVEAGKLRGRIWVTRTSPHIDRLASAWLIRRYVDSKARFKLVKAPYHPKSSKEIRFDMSEAEFTHFGDWCTFETLMHRLRLKDPALEQLAEIIHDVDLKDRKFSRTEASGIALAIRGICRKHEEDIPRLEAGIRFFDGVHAALAAEAKG